MLFSVMSITSKFNTMLAQKQQQKHTNPIFY